MRFQPSFPDLGVAATKAAQSATKKRTTRRRLATKAGQAHAKARGRGFSVVESRQIANRAKAFQASTKGMSREQRREAHIARRKAPVNTPGAGGNTPGAGGFKFDADTARAFLQSTGSQVRETAGGYSYPEIPGGIEDGIPDYYSASRRKRGLPDLPAEAGQLARKIGRYVANLPSDPDNRGTIEGTIAQVLVAAAQEADAQGDAENATRLSKIAGEWAKLVRSRGMSAPDPDAPLPLAGFDYGAMGGEGSPSRAHMAAMVGGGAMLAVLLMRNKRKGVAAETAKIGAATGFAAYVLLGALGYGG